MNKISLHNPILKKLKSYKYLQPNFNNKYKKIFKTLMNSRKMLCKKKIKLMNTINQQLFKKIYVIVKFRQRIFINQNQRIFKR